MPQTHSSNISSYSHTHLPLRSSQREQSQNPAGRHGYTHHLNSEVHATPLRVTHPRTTRREQGTVPRPHHGPSHSYLPQVKTPQVINPVAHHGNKPRKYMAAGIEEPEFVREEREAWQRRSPKAAQNSEVWSQVQTYGRATRASYPNPGIILQPLPQPRKQTNVVLPLREFAPITQEPDIEDRPKTSRGPSSFPELESTSRPSQESQDSSIRSQAVRRSRFLEGSLTDRSAAVASSWYDNDSLSGDSYDSNATPRASKDICGSSSFDSFDSKELAKTPATVKRKKLFSLRSSLKPSETVKASTEQQAVPKRKGLRKSLSSWNLHSLGDKMRIFGPSTNDLTPKVSKERSRPSKTPVKDFTNDVLDERKRKAEEAYSRQFGLKKQKSNSGIATSMNPSQGSIATKPSSLKQRTPSSSSQTSSTGSRSRVQSSKITHTASSELGMGDLDKSKRPSRQELEKENQHLRRMLRQSSSMHFDAHRSSIHLPLYVDPLVENIPRLSQEDFAQGHKMRVSPGKKMGRRGEDVPPVPKLSREVLGELESGWNGRSRSIDGKGVLPRPVSMILEEEDRKEVVEMADDAADGDVQMAPVKEHWEWPDDVF